MEYHEDRGFRLLKFVVKAMGIILIAGIFFLFFVVVKRIENPNFMRLKPRCTLESLESITVKGTVLNSFIQDKKLILLVKQEEGKALLTLDPCTGETIYRTPIIETEE